MVLIQPIKKILTGFTPDLAIGVKEIGTISPKGYYGGIAVSFPNDEVFSKVNAPAGSLRRGDDFPSYCHV
jgi:hypothetical protein